MRKTFGKAKSLLLKILRESLWRNNVNMPDELKEEECQFLLSLSRKQAVLGLIVDSLIRHNVRMPQANVFEAIGTLKQVKDVNRLVNEGVIKLCNLMREYGVNYAVMKGQVVASYYPDSLIRQSGDIDYYCNIGYYNRSIQVIKEKWGIQPEINGSEKHADFDCHGNRYEAHFRLTDLHSRLRNEYLEKLIGDDKRETITIDDTEVWTFSPTLHSLYIFLHLYYHLLELGVGLRQFCDWTMILHACKDEIDHEAIRQHLKALGMEKAYRACGVVLVRDLGLPADEFTYEFSNRDLRYADKILDVVFYRGNMGHYNKRSSFHGWKHKIESTGIKLSHLIKFYPLAPAFMRDWFWDVIKSRVCQ